MTTRLPRPDGSQRPSRRAELRGSHKVNREHLVLHGSFGTLLFWSTCLAQGVSRLTIFRYLATPPPL